MNRVLAVFVLILSLFGCAGNVAHKIVINPENGSKAVLVPATYNRPVSFFEMPVTYYVQIMAVDDIELEGAWDKAGVPVYVEPGEHNITVRMFEFRTGLVPAIASFQKAKSTAKTIPVKVEQNRIYVVKAKVAELQEIMLIKSPKSFDYSFEPYAGDQVPEYELIY